MKSSITIRGPVKITYLRNGCVRIEAERRRARMHLRTDEFMRLLNTAANPASTAPLLAANDARCGVL